MRILVMFTLVYMFVQMFYSYTTKSCANKNWTFIWLDKKVLTACIKKLNTIYKTNNELCNLKKEYTLIL